MTDPAPGTHEELDGRRLLDVLDREGGELVAAVRAAELDAAVPGCPGWTVRDLARHVAWVYRWAALIVGEGRTRPPDRDERSALNRIRSADDELVPGLAEAHAGIVRTLREAPAELDCWTMWPAPSAREYWIRRQAHETVVHHVDARDAGAPGVVHAPDVAADVAADGVDEMVLGFANRYADKLRSPEPRTLVLHATDPDAWWWIRVSDQAPVAARGRPGAGPSTVVTATAADLLLLLWNRRPPRDGTVDGDPEVLRLWRELAR